MQSFLRSARKWQHSCVLHADVKPTENISEVIGTTRVKKLGGEVLDVEFDLVNFKARYFYAHGRTFAKLYCASNHD